MGIFVNYTRRYNFASEASRFCIMAKTVQRETQARTKETRKLLLEAAEKIFVRDGYEKAQVAQIAAAAGRTKGAVYAHFKNKEDFFLALFEERSAYYSRAMKERMKNTRTKNENLLSLREFYSHQASDKAWALLILEFKLFAIRHPESKRRLRRMHRTTRPSDIGEQFHRIFGAEAAEDKFGMDSARAALAPILSGLVLESQIEPVLFSETRLTLMLQRIFDALIVPERK
jgi:AcrR family transcriptional regulator